MKDSQRHRTRDSRVLLDFQVSLVRVQPRPYLGKMSLPKDPRQTDSRRPDRILPVFGDAISLLLSFHEWQTKYPCSIARKCFLSERVLAACIGEERRDQWGCVAVLMLLLFSLCQVGTSCLSEDNSFQNTFRFLPNSHVTPDFSAEEADQLPALRSVNALRREGQCTVQVQSSTVDLLHLQAAT